MIANHFFFFFFFFAVVLLSSKHQFCPREKQGALQLSIDVARMRKEKKWIHAFPKRISMK